MEAAGFLEYGELNVDFMTETEPFISDVTKLKLYRMKKRLRKLGCCLRRAACLSSDCYIYSLVLS